MTHTRLKNIIMISGLALPLLVACPGPNENTNPTPSPYDETASLELQGVASSLSISQLLGANLDWMTVSSDLTLPKVIGGNISIRWDSSDKTLITNDGKVFPPKDVFEDTIVVLKASFSSEDLVTTRLYEFQVRQSAAARKQAFIDMTSIDLSALLGDNESTVQIISSLKFDQVFDSKLDVSWHSSNEDIIDAEGQVTRPTHAEGNQNVTITIKFSHDSYAEVIERPIQLTVVAEKANTAAFLKAELDKITSSKILATGDLSSSVRSDLKLANINPEGLSITWTSSNPAVLSPEGKVSRPAFSVGDADVVLSVYLAKDNLVEQKNFSLTVKKLPRTDRAIVEEQIESFDDTIILAANNNRASITTDLDLLTKIGDSVRIEWKSSHPDIISLKGVVKRPSFAEGNQTVTLEARFSKDSFTSAPVSFAVTVLKLEKTDAERVATAITELTEDSILKDNPSKDAITTDLNLSNTAQGLPVTWQSDAEAVISPSGLVNRPSFEAGDKTVKLTGTVRLGAASAQRSFTLVVKKAELDLAAIADQLKLQDILLDNEAADRIMSDLKLAKSLGSTVQVSWTSDAPELIASSGSVTRPKHSEGDRNVVLTAILTGGSESISREFSLTVLAEIDPVEAAKEVLAAAKNLLTEKRIKGSKNIKLSHIAHNMNLVTRIGDGVRVSWASSNQDAIYTSGYIVRPSYLEDGHAAVTLTATLSFEGQTAEKIFEALVIQRDPNKKQAVELAIKNLTASVILGDNASLSAVTQDLNLIKKSKFGVRIEWQTSNSTVIKNDGTVLRPTDGSETAVELTATINRHDYQDTKVFNIIVK